LKRDFERERARIKRESKLKIKEEGEPGKIDMSGKNSDFTLRANSLGGQAIDAK